MPNSLFSTETESAYLKAAPADHQELGRPQRDHVPLEAQIEAAPQTDRTNPLAILAE